MTTYGSSQYSLDDLLAEAQRRSDANMSRQQRFGYRQPDPVELAYLQGGLGTLSEQIQDPDAFRREITPGVTPGATPRDYAIANLRQRLKETTPAYQQMSPQERQQAAVDIFERQQQAGFTKPSIFGGDIQVEAQQAAARLEAFRNHEYEYPTLDAQVRDFEILKAATADTQQQLNRARGDSGPVSFGLGVATGASGGLGEFIRSKINPELAGLEQQAMLQHPLANIGGQLVGGLAPLGGAARAGAGLTGRAAGRLGAGETTRAFAGIAGGFAAGEAAQAPMAFNQAIAAGASPQDAARAAKEAALAYPLIADKLISGEQLDDADYIDIAFLLPEVIGVAPDIKTALRNPTARLMAANRLREQARLSEALEVDEAAREALSPQLSQLEQPGQVQSELVLPEEPPSFPQDIPIAVDKQDVLQRQSREGFEERDLTRRAVQQGILKPGTDMPGVRATPEPGQVEADYEALQRGMQARQGRGARSRFPDTISQDEMTSLAARNTADIERYRVQGDLEGEIEAEKGLQQVNLETIDHRGEDFVKVRVPLNELEILGDFDERAVEDIKSYRDQDPATAPPIIAGPPAQGSAPLSEGKTLLVTDGKRRSVAAMARGDSEITAYVPKWYADQLQAQPRGQFTEVPGRKLDRETEVPEYGLAIRARKYRPGSIVHVTTLDALEPIAMEGIQIGSAETASGFDAGLFGTRINEFGELHSPNYGRDRVPVVLELSDNVRGAAEPGPTEIAVEGKGYIPASEIVGVYVGKDSKRYTLDEAIRRVRELQAQRGQGVSDAEGNRVRADEGRVAQERRQGQDVRGPQGRDVEQAAEGPLEAPDEGAIDARATEAERGQVEGPQVKGPGDAVQRGAQEEVAPPEEDLDTRLTRQAEEHLGELSRQELTSIIDTLKIPGGKAGKNADLRDRIMRAYRENRDVTDAIDRQVKKSIDEAQARAREGKRQVFDEEDDIEVNREFARAYLDDARGDPRKIDYSDISNAELLEMARLTRAAPPELRKSIREQLGKRKLKQSGITDDDIRQALGLSGEPPPAASPTPSSRTSEEGGSPERRRHPPARQHRPPPRSGSVASAQTPQQTAHALRKQALSVSDALSPHRIIADLNRKLGIGMPGVGRSKMLKTWALGFYRTTPESIRLRMADALEVHVHEIGHHLHKAIFQGGTTDRRVDKAGRPRTRTGLDQTRFPKEWSDELDKLGRALYGSQKPASGYIAEGWAEVIRLAFTNPETAKQRAPTVYEGMTKILAKDWPETYSAMETFRKQYQVYEAQSPFVKAAGYIRRSRVKDNRLLRAYDRMRIAHTDRTHILFRFKKDLGLDNLPADQDPHIVALRTFGRATGDFDTIVDKGLFDPAKPGIITGKGLADTLRPVRNDMAEFETYMVVRRALEKRKQGHKGVLSRLSDQELQQAVSDAEATYPAFKQAAEDFQKINRWLIQDYAVHHGLLDADKAKLIVDKNLDYITFRKAALYDSPAQQGTGPRKFVDTGSGVKKFASFKGEQIEPPIEAFLLHMQGIINRAQQNRVGQTLTDLFYKVEGVGRWIDKVDQPMTADTIHGSTVYRQLKKELEANGVDIEELGDDVTTLMLDLLQESTFKQFRPAFYVDKATRTFTVLKNGKPEFWEAKNDMLFEFLEGIDNPSSLSALAKFASMPRAVFRFGATEGNPDFPLPNFVRDLFNAMVVSTISPKNLSEAQAVSIARLQGMWKAFTKGDMDAVYKASGANMSGLFKEYYDPLSDSVDLDRIFVSRDKFIPALASSFNAKAYHRHFRKMVNGEGLKRVSAAGKLAAQPVASILDPLRILNERFELANRMAEFEGVLTQTAINKLRSQGIEKPTKQQIADFKKQRKEQGWERADLEAAGQAAADVTLDFTRGGKFSVQTNKFIVFWNAAFLGADKMAREIRKSPARFFGRTFNYIIIPTIVEHLLNRDDPDYYNIPFDIRDRYWHLSVGDYDNDGAREYIRIPKPYGIGALSIIVSRTLARVDGIDPATGRRGDPEAYKDVLTPNPITNALLKDFRPPYHVPIILPALELVFNGSLFYDNEIVYRGEQTGIPGERGAERSSELAATLGKALDIPPPKIDYAINGLFAGLGTSVNRLVISPIMRTVREDAMGAKPRPRRDANRFDQPEDFPIIKRLLVEESKTFNETIKRFYGTFIESENIYRSYKHREDDPEDQQDYYERHYRMLAVYDAMQPYKSELDDLFKYLRDLYRDDTLNGREFTRETRDVIDQINEIARQGMEAATQFKEDK